jgi:Fe-S-cluster containining protein
MENERLCGNCCFRNKEGVCVMSKKRERVLQTESASERKCKDHLFKAEIKEIKLREES